MSEWSHLPNAAHIDWVIQDVEPNPSDWFAARDAARGDAARGAARDAVFEAAHSAVGDAVWDAVAGAAGGGYLVAYHACLALIAYDHAGALFDRPLDQVRVQAYLGQPAAILMLPACEVRAMRDLG